MVQGIDAKGWAEICTLVGCSDRKTAKKRLAELHIKVRRGKPAVNINLYAERSRNHNDAEK